MGSKTRLNVINNKQQNKRVTDSNELVMGIDHWRK
jgi:hypothetical protein